jgi:hypothetical protein
MNKKEIMAAVKAHLMATFGDQFTEDLFKKAKAKASIWQRDAYGGTDWEEHFAESGASCIDFYFRECLNQSNDQMSSNRQRARDKS